MKSTLLNVRISEDLKAHLKNIALAEKVSISDLVKDILLTHVEESQQHQKKYLESLKYVKYTSNDFIFLISWLYEKRFNYYDYNSEFVLSEVKEIIMKIIKDDDYPSNLKNEFEKVFVDIIRFCNEPNNENRYFTFGIANQPTSFNYTILKEFINYNGFSMNTITL